MHPENLAAPGRTGSSAIEGRPNIAPGYMVVPHLSYKGDTSSHHIELISSHDGLM